MTEIQVTKSSMPKFDEYIEEIKPLWESRHLTNFGVIHNAFQKQLSEFLDVPNVSLFVNGHSALESILQAYDFPKGSEIITTPFTFISTTQAIVRSGFIPVFCDVEIESGTIDTAEIEKLINKNTVAIMPVHVYGNLCDIEGIKTVSEKYDLKVIYDAAHTFGEKKDGISTANFGDASVFSFHATKVFHSVEGGAVCFKDEKLIDKLNAIKNFGILSERNIPYIGDNSKMSEFHAAMGICNLRHLDEEIQKRKKAAERYRENLKDNGKVKLFKIQEGVESNYAYFPVIFDSKKRKEVMMEKFADNDIFARRYFYPLTSEAKCFQSLFNIQDTPVAKELSDKILCLPLYADLEEEIVDRICKLIKE